MSKQKVLDYILLRVKQDKLFPYPVEISDATGINRNSVWSYLRRLEHDGWIVKGAKPGQFQLRRTK